MRFVIPLIAVEYEKSKGNSLNYDQQCVIMNMPSEIDGGIYGLVKRVRTDHDCSRYDTK